MVELSLARVIDDLEKGDTSKWTLNSGNSLAIDGLFPNRGAKSIKVDDPSDFQRDIGSPLAGWLSGWSYRKSHVINSATGAGTNYQVKIIVHYGSGSDSGDDVYLNSKCRTDFRDVYFTDSDKVTKLDFWIESKVDSDNAVFWIEVTDDLGSNQTIYAYYGKSSASDVSNGEDTFIFFDDFESVWSRKGNAIATPTVMEPSVIYEGNPQILTGEDNVFKMWYSHGWSTAHIYYAESVDGLTWTQYGSNPIVSNHYRSNCIKIGSTYYLYAALAGHQQFDLYTSSDGVNFSLDTSSVLTVGSAGQWDEDYIANMNVWLEGTNDWKMLYEARGTVWKIGLATSTDGKSWNKSGSNPVISETGSRGGPNCHKVGSYYYLWIHGAPTGTLPTEIHRYRSTDLISWTVYPSNSVFPRATADEGVGLSNGQVADSFHLEHNDQVYMWYAASTNGASESGNMHIKLAIADMTLAELVTTNENADMLAKWTGDKEYGSVSDSILAYHHTLDEWKNIKSNVTFPKPCVCRAKIKQNVGDVMGFIYGLQTMTPNTQYARLFDTETAGTIKAQTCDGVDWSNDNLITGIDETIYNITDVRWKTGESKYYYNDVLKQTVSIYNPTANMPVWIATRSTLATLYVDWTLIRKYVDPEPTHGNWGSEETATTENWSNFDELIIPIAGSGSFTLNIYLNDSVGGSQLIHGPVNYADGYKYYLIKIDVSAKTRTDVTHLQFKYSNYSGSPYYGFVDDIILSRKDGNYITLEPKPAVWNIDMVMRIPETDIPNRVGGILQGIGSSNQRLAIEGLFKKGTTHASSYYYLMKKLQSYANNNNIVVFSDPGENFILPGMVSNVSFKRGSKKEWFPYDFDFTEFAELGGEDL